jgi:hypothetical protein
MPGSDAYHLCQDCLNEFRKFARNEWRTRIRTGNWNARNRPKS